MGPPRSALRDADAIALLATHHERVTGLVANLLELCKQNDAAGNPSALVDSICHDLALHSALAEELFFPAARRALDDATLVDAALKGRGEAAALVGELVGATPGNESYVAKARSLRALLGRQLAVEENLFKAARRSRLDVAALGQSMIDRKLMLEHAYRFDGAHWLELPGS